MFTLRVSAATSLVACVATSVVVRTAASQLAGTSSDADTASIELAAARYVHDVMLPTGQVHFDPRVLTATGRSRMRSTGREALLARALGARVAPIDSLVVCPGVARACRLLTDHVVEFRQPHLLGDRAAVGISLLSRTQSAERPILGQGITLLLQRDTSGIWRVVGRGKRTRQS